ncbi:SDR family oxidoreductase [Piscinibacter sp.]|uniref:SDR family oxidoreductase n=1 Tax=Piscinibacter sp. TaxID=1903157 RepID=UPI0039E68FBB
MTAPARPLALVVGGSRGIGAASVRALVRDGFDVALTYVCRPDDARQLQAQCPPASRVGSYALDVADPQAVARMFAEAARDFGRAPRVVVVNAGINVPPAPLAQFPDDRFRRLMEVNLLGAFHVLREAARRVEDGGAIVALSTSLVRHAVPGAGPYAATKAAVESLVRSMARELAGRGVRVNAVAPGPVDTELFNAGKTEEAKQRMAAMSPFQRIGTPEEVAEVVAFLASDAASWVHGQVVQPNGGLV